jgi:SAM-dependent methyltransferase
MAHPKQLCYFKTLAKHLTDDYTNTKILEIGSYNVNGTIRDFFIGSDYIGTDLTEGPCVDFVSDGHLIDHDDDTYDLTVSCESFEHNPYWLETFRNMYRMTKDGGIVAFTCATRGRLEHGTRRTSPESSPGTQDVGWDYYRNLEEKDFRKDICFDDLFDNYLFLTNKHSHDLYFVGVKTGMNKKFSFDKVRFVDEHTHNQIKVEILLRKPSGLSQKLSYIALTLSLKPVRLLALLPEKHFQNFAVFYFNFLRLVANSAKKLIHIRTKPPQP